MAEEALPRGIFRRGNIFWIRYADLKGKIRREPGGGTLKQAESKLGHRRYELRKGIQPHLKDTRNSAPVSSGVVTFGTWIDAAADHHDRHSGAKHAYDFGRKFIYLREKFGETPVAEMNRNTILDWMEEAAEGGVTGNEEWGPANWNRYHSCWSSIFTLAIERAIADKQELLPVNPMQWIYRKTENFKERYWSAEEDAAIIGATQKLFPGADYENIFVLAEEVGYRKSEQLRSVVGDYNSLTHKIVVHQRKNKSAGPVRYVPLSDRGLEAYERLAKGKNPGEPLLTRKFKGKSMPMIDTRYWFDDVLAEAKIIDDAASWHVSRHTFCSRAVAAGVPITDVKEYAGHSDLRTTARYTHGVEGVSDVRNREALNHKSTQQSQDVSALQQQIAALTALVERLSK